MADKLALNVSEAAEALRISRQSMYKLLNDDPTFPAFKLGGRTLISSDGLRKWIENKVKEQTL